MLKKFLKECPYLVVILLLLEIAGIVIIFLGAFTAVPVIARCFLLIMGIVCVVGSTTAWIILMYECERLDMLIKLKNELVKEEYLSLDDLGDEE